MKKCPQLLSGQLTCVLLCAARSPVFSHLSSSLQGLWTIRAFRAEERFQEVFDAHQNLHSRKLPPPPVASHSAGVELADGCFFCSRLLAEAWFLFLTTSRWFALRLDAICSVFVTVTTFGCLILRDRKHVDPPPTVFQLLARLESHVEMCVGQSWRREPLAWLCPTPSP